jgi:microsomal dipeptidase-like Zn-dependent dipeptidase
MPGAAVLHRGVLVVVAMALVSTAAYAGHPDNRLDCGGPLQRACCTFEAFPSCDTGLLELAGCNNESLCGGCSSGYCNYSAPTADKFPHCGGHGQRACCVTEVGLFTRKCDAGMIEVNGCVGDDCEQACGPGGGTAVSTCIAITPCGGEGQRACCHGELIDDTDTCHGGFVEIAGCTGDCLCGGGEGGANPFQISSNGTCVPQAPTKLPLASEPTTNWTAPAAGPRCALSGYADLHAHLFAHLGSGQGAFAGRPYDPDGGVNTAIGQDYGTTLDLVKKDGTELGAPSCPFYLDGCGDRLFHGDHVIIPVLGIGADDPVGVGTQDKPRSPLGAPLFNGWPTWTTTTHQQMYYTWLERAYRGGLRLMVMLAVSNEALCKGNKRSRTANCEESMLPPGRLADLDQFDERFRPRTATPPALPPIEAQLQAAYEFEDWLDQQSGGPGTGWFRIVRTPEDAREVIDAGKLAVVLGIEVDHPFGCRFDGPCTSAHVSNAVDKYHDKGVRHIFPIHNFDNQFGSPAAWQDAINVGNRAVTGHWWGVEDCGGDQYGFWLDAFIQTLISTLGFGNFEAPLYTNGNFEPDFASCNANGLTPLGDHLLDTLMDKGMIIDIDHMSRRSVEATLTKAEARVPPYPLVTSHTIFFDLHDKEFGDNFGRHERMRTRAQLERIRALGGMVAVMLKDDVQDTDKKGQKVTVAYGAKIADDCMHSTKTWGQAYQYAVDTMGGPVAMGSDFNGIAGHLGPRFGTDACGGDGAEDQEENHLRQLGTELRYPFTLPGFGTFARQKTGLKEFDFNSIGLAHVGLLPDMIADLRQVGLSNADLDPLFKSAEEYIRVWERAEGKTSPDTPFPPTGACLDDPAGGTSLGLGEAKVWIGLANSDAVGLRLDLRAEVSLDGALVGSGELLGVPAGSSGFNRAVLRAISLGAGDVDVSGGGELAVTLKVRRTCSRPKGHASGTVRLWYNGAPMDSGRGRDAGSRLTLTVDGQPQVLFLGAWPELTDVAGSARTFADMPVTSDEACPDRPYTPIGTWSGPVAP